MINVQLFTRESNFLLLTICTICWVLTIIISLQMQDRRGYDRYERIETTLNEKNGVITEDYAMDLLSQVALNYQHKTLKHMVIALRSAVYNCNEKSMLLCAGMNYTKKYKFYVDKTGEWLSS